VNARNRGGYRRSAGDDHRARVHARLLARGAVDGRSPTLRLVYWCAVTWLISCALGLFVLGVYGSAPVYADGLTPSDVAPAAIGMGELLLELLIAGLAIVATVIAATRYLR
jgi:hypothetical protein